jgi:hypothetical protein
MLEGIIQTINGLESFFGKMKHESIDLWAARFDALRETSFLEKLELLKPEKGLLNRFEVVEEIPKAWYVEFGEDRKDLTVLIARNDETFTAAMQQSTHVRVNGIIYTVTDDDTLPPLSMEKPYWSLVCKRFAGKSEFKRPG